MPTYGLLCPFLDERPEYAFGFELGLLYAKMTKRFACVVKDYFLIDNQEQIFLLASRMGWEVVDWHPWEIGWFWCCLAKKLTTPETHPAAFPSPPIL